MLTAPLMNLIAFGYDACPRNQADVAERMLATRAYAYQWTYFRKKD